METTKVSVFCFKFLRSFGPHISLPHPNQYSTARTVEKRSWVGQSLQWRQWKGYQGLGTGNGTVRSGRGKQVSRRYSTWGTMEIHEICKTTLEAAAVVEYIKEIRSQEITTRFLMGKTRVAPLRQTPIPRLKLRAALYAAKLMKTVEDEMDFKFDNIFLWCDRMTVLNWIKNFKLKHKMYSGNRIAEKGDFTSTNQWNFVNTKKNPADQETRWLTA